MRRIVAVVLITLLVAPPALADQKQGKPISWEKAKKIGAGTEIVLTVTGGQPTKERLLFADEALIVTLKTTAPELPGKVTKFLFGLGPLWPAILDGESCTDGKLRVSQSGIFDRDKKLADLAEVVQLTPRGDVFEIAKARPSHVVRYIALGAFLMMVVPGIVMAIMCAHSNCT